MPILALYSIFFYLFAALPGVVCSGLGQGLIKENEVDILLIKIIKHDTIYKDTIYNVTIHKYTITNNTLHFTFQIEEKGKG